MSDLQDLYARCHTLKESIKDFKAERSRMYKGFCDRANSRCISSLDAVNLSEYKPVSIPSVDAIALVHSDGWFIYIEADVNSYLEPCLSVFDSFTTIGIDTLLVIGVITQAEATAYEEVEKAIHGASTLLGGLLVEALAIVGEEQVNADMEVTKNAHD